MFRDTYGDELMAKLTKEEVQYQDDCGDSYNVACSSLRPISIDENEGFNEMTSSLEKEEEDK